MGGSSASLTLNFFDGARQPLSSLWRVLVRLIDGAGRTVWAKYHRGPSVYFRRLPFHDDFRDNYTVVISAPKCMTVGFTAIRLHPERLTSIDLMLPPRHGSFDFRSARWPELERTRAQWIRLLKREHYEWLMEERPAAMAGLLNLLAALEQTPLGETAALDYVEELIWDPPPAPDRFFAWAHATLLDQVEQAAKAGRFSAVWLPGLFHPGATASFKEIRLPVANLQLTFHAHERRQIRGRQCLKLEPDIDYYRDPAAHALLEVLPNTLLGQVSDPRVVYMLRWMAARFTGLPEFAPPYTIA